MRYVQFLKLGVVASVALAAACVAPEDTTDDTESVDSAEAAATELTEVTRGDANRDGRLDISDAMAIFNQANGYGSLSGCGLGAADVNLDGRIDRVDGMHVLEYLFEGSAPQPQGVVPCQATLEFDPDQGSSREYISQGEAFVMPLDGQIAWTELTWHGATRIRIHTGEVWWRLEFHDPFDARVIPGIFENAKRYPFNDDAPGINVSGQGRGCNRIVGEFTVHSAVYDGEDVLYFHADFTQACEHASGEAPQLHGSVVMF